MTPLAWEDQRRVTPRARIQLPTTSLADLAAVLDTVDAPHASQIIVFSGATVTNLCETGVGRDHFFPAGTDLRRAGYAGMLFGRRVALDRTFANMVFVYGTTP